MGSVHDVIEAFRKAPSNAERGTKFEQLMVRYFELDPTMAQQYDAVWRWIDWPERRGRTDTGIDLVARERDTGNYTAIQCKFYEPTHTLAKGDIDSFFTASGKTGFTNRVIISTTDRWGRNAEDALADQLVPVQRIGMAEIAESPIDWDIAWPAGDLQVNLTPAKRHELRPHRTRRFRCRARRSAGASGHRPLDPAASPCWDGAPPGNRQHGLRRRRRRRLSTAVHTLSSHALGSRPADRRTAPDRTGCPRVGVESR